MAKTTKPIPVARYGIGILVIMLAASVPVKRLFFADLRIHTLLAKSGIVVSPIYRSPANSYFEGSFSGASTAVMYEGVPRLEAENLIRDLRAVPGARIVDFDRTRPLLSAQDVEALESGKLKLEAPSYEEAKTSSLGPDWFDPSIHREGKTIEIFGPRDSGGYVYIVVNYADEIIWMDISH